MREAFGQLLKTKIQKPVAHIGIRKMKNLVLLLFAAGFFCFLIFGARFMDDISLLNSASLRRIRDTQIDKGAFFRYLCLSHMLLLLFCVVCWWFQWGKKCIYTLVSLGSIILGVSLAVSIIRYHIKGIVLWFILYFPHTLFYFAALACGIALSRDVGRSRTEKIHFLLQNFIWLLGALMMWLIGLYMECYMSTSILQNYLQHF